MFLSGPPGIFPSGRISNVDATCWSTISSRLSPHLLGFPYNTISRLSDVQKYLTILPPSHPKSTFSFLADESLGAVVRQGQVLTPQPTPLRPAARPMRTFPLETPLLHLLYPPRRACVARSVPPEFLLAANVPSLAWRKQQRWDRPSAVWSWNEWLSWERSVAVALLKEPEGDIHFTGAEWSWCWEAARTWTHGPSQPLKYRDAVFSWLCARTGKTWCGRWRWTARRWGLGCRNAAAAGRRSPWWSGADPSGSSWSSAPRWPRPAPTRRCSPAGAGSPSGRKTTDLKHSGYCNYTFNYPWNTKIPEEIYFY